MEAFRTTGYSFIKTNSKDAMKEAVSKQVVPIAVYADSAFQLYKTGIFDKAPTTTGLNHGVALVGYTETYFVLRNSWATSWGEKGYMRITDKYDTKGGCANIYAKGTAAF